VNTRKVSVAASAAVAGLTYAIVSVIPAHATESVADDSPLYDVAGSFGTPILRGAAMIAVLALGYLLVRSRDARRSNRQADVALQDRIAARRMHLPTYTGGPTFEGPGLVPATFQNFQSQRAELQAQLQQVLPQAFEPRSFVHQSSSASVDHRVQPAAPQHFVPQVSAAWPAAQETPRYIAPGSAD
jgi:type IV secretory pathway VirB2 component (pilin)